MYSAGLPGSSSGHVGALAAKSPMEELTVLQRRLAEESSERDASKMALQRMLRTLDFYRQRLSAFAGSRAGGGIENLQRIRDITQAMENEIRAAPTSEQSLQELQAASQAPLPGYDVLRQSLEDTHRRCESLNSDMVHQTEANEELVDALGTVKDANKRLLEQIRFQTDEIAQLTQQRIGDEERMDKLTRKHQSDHEAFRQNLQRQMHTIRTTAADEFGSCSRRLTDKLRYLKTRVEIIAQDAGHIRQEQMRLRLDVGNMVNAMQAQLRSAERDISARCSDHAEACAKRQQASEEGIADLENKLTAERDLRHSEGLSWGHKHSTLLAEREDVQARHSRDLCQLGSHTQSADRTLVVEMHSIEAERASLTTQLDEIKVQHIACQQNNDQLQRDLVRLESSRGAVESDIRSKEQIAADLRRQIRESDDALAAAVSGNEHLRLQMEEQRIRFQQKNEADLADARASYEQKLNDARATQETDVATASRQLQDMEESSVKDEEALQALRAQVGVVTSEIESLGRDSQMWRGQNDAAKTSRSEAERAAKEARQSFAVERLKLQAAIERLHGQTASTEDEIKSTWDHIEEFRRVSAARETEQVTRIGAAELVVRDAQEQLAHLKKRFFETLDVHSKLESETSSGRQRALDVHAALEQDLESKKRSVAEERRKLQDQANSEQRATAQSREQLDREKEASIAMLRRVQEESRSKLTAVERERVRIEEACRADTGGANDSVSHQQKYTDALEQDLSKLRYLLTESDANLSWVKQELEREEREAGIALKQLQNGAQSASAELEKATKGEVDLVRQIEETSLRNKQEQARLGKELEALRRAAAAEEMESEAKLSRFRTDVAQELRAKDDHHRSAQNVERFHEEALERENSQLKSFLAEQTSHSGNLSSLHNKLENHIQRLQKHTEDLRRDIHSSTGATPGDLHLKSPRRAGVLAAAALSPRAKGDGDGELHLDLRAHIPVTTSGNVQDGNVSSATIQLISSPKRIGSSAYARQGDLSSLGLM
jgi:chromosome segregation ATPase